MIRPPISAEQLGLMREALAGALPGPGSVERLWWLAGLAIWLCVGYAAARLLAARLDRLALKRGA